MRRTRGRASSAVASVPAVAADRTTEKTKLRRRITRGVYGGTAFHIPMRFGEPVSSVDHGPRDVLRRGTADVPDPVVVRVRLARVEVVRAVVACVAVLV